MNKEQIDEIRKKAKADLPEKVVSEYDLDVTISIALDECLTEGKVCVHQAIGILQTKAYALCRLDFESQREASESIINQAQSAKEAAEFIDSLENGNDEAA
jgi:hypothetical protein